MSNFERQLGAKDFNASVGVGATIPTNNDFDNVYPWSKIELVSDEYGNQFVRIPKFYTKYDLDEEGNVTGRYISEYLISEKDGWFLNPVFKSSEGEDLNYVDVGAYLLGNEGGQLLSKSGLTPIRNQYVSTVQTQVANYSGELFEYSLMDIWTLQMLQDLFAIEFCTTDCQSIMQGYIYDTYNNNGTLIANGETDGVSYVTGYTTALAEELNKAAMKYRYIENLWGNGQTFIDGIQFNGEVISVKKNGAYETVSAITKGLSDGVVYKLKFDPETKLLFPNAIDENGGYKNIYTKGVPSGTAVMYNGSNNNNCGLWAYQTSAGITGRLP